MRTSRVVAVIGVLLAAALSAPPAQATDTGTITVLNNTPNPILVLSGPVSCIYDNAYLFTYSKDKDSHLGGMNGSLLMAGQSVDLPIVKDASDLDSRETMYVSNTILQNWLGSVVNTYGWLLNGPLADQLPKLAAADIGMVASEAQVIGRMVSAPAVDRLATEGVFNTFYNAISLAVGYTLDLLVAFEVIAKTVPFLDQILAIVGDIIAGAENICSSTHEGLFMVGAIDVVEPWRQFAGVYDWNQGLVKFAPGTKNDTYLPYANGMVAYDQTQLVSEWDFVSDDAATTLSLPFDDGCPGCGEWTFAFTEPDPAYSANFPARIGLTGRTVSCALDPRDAARQTQVFNRFEAAGTQYFLPGWPNAVWDLIDSTSASDITQTMPTTPAPPANYAVGLNYVPPGAQPTTTIYTSADGLTWADPVNIPAGQSWTIPASTPAKLVQCTVQMAETFTEVTTINGRSLIMGTRVMSDVIQGPDD